METNYNQEQEAFRASLRRFLEDRSGTGVARQNWDDAIGCPPSDWQGLVELGATALLSPTAAGGLDGTLVDMGVLMEELGRYVHPAPCWSTCVGATDAARVFQLDELNTQLNGGSRRGTLALAEPGRLFSDWSEANVSVAGNLLSGTKVEVPDGVGADVLFVTTQDGVYLVEAGAAGLSVTAEDNLDGSRRFATVHLNDTPGTRLGDNQTLAATVDRMLVALCADGLGAAQRVLELTVAYAGERQQFGQAIGSFQAVQHLCADMLQQLELGRAGLHHALWAQDGADRTEAHRSAVMCKAYMSEVFPGIGASAIQVFGGAGFTWEYDIQLYYKRLLTLQMSWGTAETWLEVLAQLVLDQEQVADE